jgi:hypothetical protein
MIMEVEDIWGRGSCSFTTFEANWEMTIVSGIEATDIRYYTTTTDEHTQARTEEE